MDRKEVFANDRNCRQIDEAIRRTFREAATRGYRVQKVLRKMGGQAYLQTNGQLLSVHTYQYGNIIEAEVTYPQEA